MSGVVANSVRPCSSGTAASLVLSPTLARSHPRESSSLSERQPYSHAAMAYRLGLSLSDLVSGAAARSCLLNRSGPATIVVETSLPRR